MSENDQTVIIGQMDESFIENVLQIENTSFKTPWPRQIFLSELNKGKAFCRVASKNENAVAGYCISNLIYDELHILKVAVHEKFRRQGIGKLLIEDAIVFFRDKGAINIVLEVRVSNDSAIALYSKMGFKPVRIRKNYYQTTSEDALVMIMELEAYYQKLLSTT